MPWPFVCANQRHSFYCLILFDQSKIEVSNFSFVEFTAHNNTRQKKKKFTTGNGTKRGRHAGRVRAGGGDDGLAVVLLFGRRTRRSGGLLPLRRHALRSTPPPTQAHEKELTLIYHICNFEGNYAGLSGYCLNSVPGTRSSLFFIPRSLHLLRRRSLEAEKARAVVCVRPTKKMLR
jgi:hypothetical protein